MSVADVLTVKTDRLPGIQTQHRQRFIHRANFHRVLQHTDPAPAVFTAHAKAGAQGANHAFGGTHHEWPTGAIAGGLHHDFAAVKLQLPLRAVKVDIHRAVGVKFQLTAVAQSDLVPLPFTGTQLGHQRLRRIALVHGPAAGTDGQEHG
ncbi:hypothetical protein D3C77_412170 [compost metagenome]